MNNLIGKVTQGDCLDILKTMPDNSLDCVITSPPYFQLRDYNWTGQWGLEKTYQEYLEHLWSLMDEIYRTLKDTGTVWFNLGDTYSTLSGGMASGDMGIGKEESIGNSKLKQTKDNNIPSKCLMLIPHRFAIGCIDRGWIVRNDIIWAKRNGMPESVTDRFTKKHEYIFFMAKKDKYYFDLNSVRDNPLTENILRNRAKESYGIGSGSFGDGNSMTNSNNPLGKNPGSISDFWDIPTKPSSEKHYATFNFNLIDKPILAGCPKGGIVCDMFAGTGTTLVRAEQLGRKVIGIEGNADYCKRANELLKKEQDQLKLPMEN